MADKQLHRSFAEFILSALRRFFASLSMTSEGLRMTRSEFPSLSQPHGLR
jgi:hypothetical protein